MKSRTGSLKFGGGHVTMRTPTHLRRESCPPGSGVPVRGPGLALPGRQDQCHAGDSTRAGSTPGAYPRGPGMQVWTTCRKRCFLRMPLGSALDCRVCLCRRRAIRGWYKFFFINDLWLIRCLSGPIVSSPGLPGSSITADFCRCGKTVRKTLTPRIPFREIHLRRIAPRTLHIADHPGNARVRP